MFSSQSRKMRRYLKFLIPHRSTCGGARWNWSTVPCSSVLLCGPWGYLDILQPPIATARGLVLSWLQAVASVSTPIHILLRGNAGGEVYFIPHARLLGLPYNLLAPFCQREEWEPKRGSYPPSLYGWIGLIDVVGRISKLRLFSKDRELEQNIFFGIFSILRIQ